MILTKSLSIYSRNRHYNLLSLTLWILWTVTRFTIVLFFGRRLLGFMNNFSHNGRCSFIYIFKCFLVDWFLRHVYFISKLLIRALFIAGNMSSFTCPILLINRVLSIVIILCQSVPMKKIGKVCYCCCKKVRGMWSICCRVFSFHHIEVVRSPVGRWLSQNPLRRHGFIA